MPVALHRIAELLSDRYADPGMFHRSRLDIDHKRRAGIKAFFLHDGAEFIILAYSVLFLHRCLPHRHSQKKSPEGDFYADNTFLPFLRRRANTLRPPTVAIRALKP